MTSSSEIALVGIGNMGAALAHALLGAGTKVTAWNRTADRALVKSVISAGASFQPDLSQAIHNSSGLVIVCVLNYDTIYTIFGSLAAANDALAGKTVINLTNGTPKQAAEMKEWIMGHGADDYYDGAVLVTPQMVATPQSLLVYSGGTEDAFDGIREHLLPLGLPLYYGPTVEAAAAQDLAMLATMYGMFYGAFVGVGMLKQIGRASGAQVAPGIKQITAPIIAALTPLLSLFAEIIDKEDWSDNGGNPLSMQVAAVENIIQAAADSNVDAGGFAVLVNAMKQAVKSGWGDGSLTAAIVHMMK